MQNFIGNGFLLTRQSKDERHGIRITLWLKSAGGPVKLVIDNEQAVFFIESGLTNNARHLLNENGVNIEKVTPL